MNLPIVKKPDYFHAIVHDVSAFLPDLETVSDESFLLKISIILIQEDKQSVGGTEIIEGWSNCNHGA